MMCSDLIPIIVITNDRPQYLMKTISALLKCDNLDRFCIHTFEENYVKNGIFTAEQNDEIFNKIKHIPVIRHINDGQKGCAKNICDGIDFVAKQYKKFVVLEDDVVPSTDFLNYILWGFEHLDERTKIILAYSRKHLENDIDHVKNKVFKNNWFTPYGWATESKTWLDFSSVFDQNMHPRDTWDHPFNIWCNNKGYLMYQPIVSRANNIGAVGTFVPSVKWHSENQLNEFYYQDEPISIVDFVFSGIIEMNRSSINQFLKGGNVYKKFIDFFISREWVNDITF